MKRAILSTLALAACLIAPGWLRGQGNPPWPLQESGVKTDLRAVSAVDNQVAWASGSNGVVLVTTDGGGQWRRCATPDEDRDGATLDFHGIQAWDAQTALVLSSGPAALSRVYRTWDGCESWTLMLTNRNPEGSYDAVAFWSRWRGLLVGDPVSRIPLAARASGEAVGEKRLNRPSFLTLETVNGGRLWEHPEPSAEDLIDPGPEGRAAFASGNGALFVGLKNAAGPRAGLFAWFGAGGRGGAAVYRGEARGSSSRKFVWSPAVPVPILGGADSSGVFAVAFRPEDKPGARPGERALIYQYGVAVGGDYLSPDLRIGSAAWSSDGGEHWSPPKNSPHGLRTAVQWSQPLEAWIAVGANGSDVSRDDGKSWEFLDDGTWNALSLPFAVGPGGRIARLNSVAYRLETKE